MSVFKKLSQVQNATRSLAPNVEGQTGTARYGYVAGAKLLGVIRPLMDKLGLLLTQEVIGITNVPTTYMTRNGEKTEMFTTLHIRFTWIDSEDGSTLVNEFYANGMNAWDKGLGSALTYAERYYLMKTFHIATDEDDVDALVRDEAITPAPVAQAPEPAPAKGKGKKSATSYTPVDNELYRKIVRAYAKGQPTKSGGNYKDDWIAMTHADADAILKFDEDVQNYINAMMDKAREQAIAQEQQYNQ